MSNDHSEQDNHVDSPEQGGNDDSTFEGPASVDNVDEPVGPEPEPDAPEPDDEQTADDLEDSGTDLHNPTGGATDFTVSVIDHKVEVDVDGVNEDDEASYSIAGLTEPELSALASRVAEQRAELAGRVPRPFEHVDKESLLVLSNQIRQELAYR